MKSKWTFVFIFFISVQLPAQTKGKVVEQIIARVNNEIITRSDLERARNSLQEEARQDCRKCSPEQLRIVVAEKEKNLLRDLIDQSLLAQRAKDMGISVETDVVRRLDQIRQQNGIASMEELEKKINESGTTFEDFKNNIRNQLLTQEVIRREVGSRIIIDHQEIQKYYDEHKNDFQRPEQVYLREIFVSTEGKSEAGIPDLEKKAKALLERVKKGEDFGELAKRYSDGTTAKSGGDLGVFERGQLAKDIETTVFQLNKGQMTDVTRTKTGFLILRVEQRFEAGLQPIEKVENEITNRLYVQKMEPGLRSYLQKLREESYVVVKPGYVDTAAVASAPIEEVTPTPEEDKSKKGKRGLFGKRKKSGV
jgi:peptidyl-prolyl cis-trans isomerase SurA